MPKKLLLIDALNVARRVYEANPMPDSPEKMQGVSRATTSSFQRALKEHQPTHLLIAVDAGGKTWRHELFPAYKEGRTPMPEELRAELDRLWEAFQLKGWKVKKQSGLEADDTLASAAGLALAQGFEVVVLSTDKDLTHLIHLGAKVYNHFDASWRDATWCEKKMGVPPALVLDWLALTGDSSDGIPGVPGVGPKTAAKLLLEHKSLEGVILSAHLVKGKVGESLRANIPTLRLSRQLTSLRVDALEEEFDLSQLALGSYPV